MSYRPTMLQRGRTHVHAEDPDAYAVGVCGFGRCGSTMVMTMLVAGGCPPGNDSKPPYEGSPDHLYTRSLAGTCVKLLGLHREVPRGSWRLVWLDRDPGEQGRSIAKFLRHYGGQEVPEREFVRRHRAAYASDRLHALDALRARGPVLVMAYERILADPVRAARRLRDELWPELDVEAAAAVVHRRNPRCRPDLSVELALTGGSP